MRIIILPTHSKRKTILSAYYEDSKKKDSTSFDII